MANNRAGALAAGVLGAIRTQFANHPVLFPHGTASKYGLLNLEVKQLASGRTVNETPVAQLSSEITYQGRGIVLYADLSGYTDLTTKLSELAFAKISERGAIDRRPSDYLAKVMLTFMERYSRICQKWGGEVSQFAGDMLICIWKVNPQEEEEDNPLFRPASEPNAFLLAKCAAADMLEATEEVSGSFRIAKMVRLHGGIGVGNLFYIDLAYIGAEGESKRCNLVTGEAFTQADGNMKAEAIGFSEMVGDPPELVQKIISPQTVTGPMREEAALLVQGVPKLVAADWAGRLADHHVNLYIPGNVTSFLADVTNREAAHTGQVIDAGVLFVSFKDVFWMSQREQDTNAVADGRIEAWGVLFRDVMVQVINNEGYLVNFLFDDKGCTLIAVFPTRLPLRAAIAISELEGVGTDGNAQRLKVALSYGEVYHGCIGGTRDRFFFNIVSSSATTAGRLLGLIGNGEVAVDSDAVTALQNKRRGVMRSSAKLSYDSFSVLRVRNSVEVNFDRIEKFDYSRVTNPKEYLNGVQDEKTWSDIETFAGQAQPNRHRPIANN